MRISTFKTEVIACSGEDPKRSKIIVNGQIIELVNKFKYFGNDLSYMKEIDVEGTINKFLRVSGFINCVIGKICSADAEIWL